MLTARLHSFWRFQATICFFTSSRFERPPTFLGLGLLPSFSKPETWHKARNIASPLLADLLPPAMELCNYTELTCIIQDHSMSRSLTYICKGPFTTKGNTFSSQVWGRVHAHLWETDTQLPQSSQLWPSCYSQTQQLHSPPGLCTCDSPLPETRPASCFPFSLNRTVTFSVTSS